MSAVILPLDPCRRRTTPAQRIQERGYQMFFRHDQVNHCPGCGRSHWHVGRSTAECAFCGTALPFATPVPGKEA
jgi:hypothetical protein